MPIRPTVTIRPIVSIIPIFPIRQIRSTQSVKKFFEHGLSSKVSDTYLRIHNTSGTSDVTRSSRTGH